MPPLSPPSDAPGQLARAVAAQALRAPHAVAVVCAGRATTYAELARTAAANARRFRDHGLAAGGLVAVLHEKCPAAYAALVGVQWAGAAFVPLSLRTPPARLAAMLANAEFAGAVVAATAPAAVARARELCARTGVALVDAAEIGRGGPACDPRAVAAGAPAYAIYTSGSTGAPKGVLVARAQLDAFVDGVGGALALRSDDRVGQHAPLDFDMSLFDLALAFDRGAAVHVPDETQRLAPIAFVRERGLTVWTSVPSAMLIDMRVGHLIAGALPSLRLICLGGEAVPDPILAAFRGAAPRAEICGIYGPTETTIVCALERTAPAEPFVLTAERGALAIGRPTAGVRFALLDERGAPQAVGVERGELAIAGAQVACGYLGDEQRTAERFVEGDFDGAGRTRWYRSGDLVRRDGARYHHLGRLDHQVKVRGQRIELEDVEANVLAALRAAGAPEAAECAVVPWPLDGAGARGLVGFVGGTTFDPPRLMAKLRELLPGPLLPGRWEACASLPRTSAGKIDRRALAAELAQRPGAGPESGSAA